MASDMFLKLDGPKMEGEAQDAEHKGEIDVLAWSWGMSQSGTTHLGPGGGAGKVNVQDISITKYVDSATHALMKCCFTGKHFEKAVLTVRKASGEDKPLEYLIIKMQDLIVTSVSTGGSGGEDRLTENISLNFAKVHVSYTPQTGSGGGEAVKKYGWNVPANTEHTG
jgi:type VI secretion system secreted protein Hcp